MPEVEPPPPEDLVDSIIKDGLEDYFKDADTANALIDMVCEETGLPKLIVKTVFRVITPWVIEKAKSSSSFFLSRAKEKSHNLLSGLKHYQTVCNSIQKLKVKLDQETERKQALKQILAGQRPVRDYEDIEGFSVDLQSSFKILAEQEDLKQQIRTGFEEVLARLDKQPDLDPRIYKPTFSNWLIFSSVQIPFLGRIEELENLQEFLDCQNPFSWWMVTGSGGTGKSRLALELCLRNWTGWRCGFLPDKEFSSFDWARWKPDQPTLMIVDYAAGRMEETRKLIETLKRNQGDAPIRVLLLERVLDEQRERELFSTGSTRAAVKEVSYKEEPLSVPPLSRDDLWDLMRGLLKKPLPHKEETLSTLEAIDKEGRPLFAALSADAINEHGNIRQWSKRHLLEDVLEREEEKWWKPTGIGELDKNLLALATLTGGLSIADKNLQALKDYLPDLDDYPAEKLQILNKARQESFISPLEPDVIGEFFLLEFLTPKNKKARKRLSTFLEYSWTLHPQRMFMFLHLMGQDFIGHSALISFLMPPKSNRYDWANMMSSLILFHCLSGNGLKVLPLYNLLEQLTYSHTGEPKLRLTLSRGAFNLTKFFAESTGQLEQATACYKTLERLSHDYPNEKELRLKHAEGLVCLMIGYNNLGRPKQAIQLFQVLTQLSGDHSNELELLLPYAQGNLSLIVSYCRLNKVDQALSIFEMLGQLVAANPHRLEMSLLKAQGAGNLATYYIISGQVDQALPFYEIFATFVDNHPTKLELRLLKAQKAHGMIELHEKDGKIEQAKKIAYEARDVLLSSDYFYSLNKEVGEVIAKEIQVFIRSLIEDGS